MTVTTEYAEYVTNLEYDDIPEDIIDYAKKLTLDAIGISIGATPRAKSSDSFIDGVDSLADGGDSTVFATGERLEPEYAALLNGALIHSLDYDDTHRGASHHPGATVIPASIAVAETADREVSGRELITAIVAGYEVNCRLGMAINPESHYERGFHGTATCGTFAATAAAAKVVGLDTEELINAFGLNGSQAAGSQQYLANGSWNKRAHPGLAAHAGVLAVSFAEAGFYGSADPIEGEDGFFNAYSDDPKPELATEGLGERFELTETGIKPYPCCRYMHAPLDAIFEILSTKSIASSEIDRIVVELSEPGVKLVGRPVERKQNPQSFVDAQFSMNFGAALAITEGEATVDAFIETSESEHSSEFKRIMEATELKTTDEIAEIFPEKWASRVTIETADETYESYVEYSNGEPENPMSWDDEIEKYEELTDHLPSATRNGLLDAVRNLETLDTSDLSAPIEADGQIGTTLSD
ncbi:MmgE/PrpD family protein [Natronorubrum sp. FCH18a]|uniref:MmgE/PrpD family protein n=1 Tax=Natronorubrum sp. FCH18a TaxID=3447018 RepID=UPI003F5199B0